MKYAKREDKILRPMGSSVSDPTLSFLLFSDYCNFRKIMQVKKKKSLGPCLTAKGNSKIEFKAERLFSEFIEIKYFEKIFCSFQVSLH